MIDILSPENNDSGSSLSDSSNTGNIDPNLGISGLEALRKERELRKQLEQQLKELSGKAQATDLLAEEITEYKSKLEIQKQEREATVQDLMKKIQEQQQIINFSRVESEFTKATSEIPMKSNYQQLLLTANKHQFQVADDGQVKTKDGKTVKEWLHQQRELFPDLFDAPKISGSGSGNSRLSNSGNNSNRVISRDNSRDYLNNLDGIIDGSVIVE